MRDRGKGSEDQASPEGRLLGPFLSPSGSATGVIPHPLGSGPPQPEPRERWTLGPRPRETAGSEGTATPVEVEPVPDAAVHFAGEGPDAPGAADE
jgi:hypothetical protein